MAPFRWTDAELSNAVTENHSWRAVMRQLGYASASGRNLGLVRAAAARLELDTFHSDGEPWNKGKGVGRDPQKQRDVKR